jgi:hypothetical protein
MIEAAVAKKLPSQQLNKNLNVTRTKVCRRDEPRDERL